MSEVDAKDVKFIKFVTTTDGVRDDDGFWKVIMTCHESLSADGKDALEESVQFMGIDKVFDSAHKTALKAYYAFMESEIWSRGTASLAVGMQMINEEKKLKEEDSGDSVKGDEVTAS